jgi:predicted aspartyl protease
MGIMKHEFIINKRKIIVEPLIMGVNDTMKFSFILDTGAAISIIDDDTARWLGFDLYRLQAGDRLTGIGGGVRSKILKLPKISLFDKDFVNFEVNVLKLPLQFTYFVDGIIGMDLLLQFENIKFDFVNKIIEV